VLKAPLSGNEPSIETNKFVLILQVYNNTEPFYGRYVPTGLRYLAPRHTGGFLEQFYCPHALADGS